MPLRAVLDATILVSALLTPGGAADAVVQYGIDERFVCCLCEDILEETTRRLHAPRLQVRYRYSPEDVAAYEALLRASFLLATDLPEVTGVVRDPNDDMVLACAVAPQAGYVVTRDDDLLSLETYEGIVMISPEAFLALVRQAAQESPNP